MLSVTELSMNILSAGIQGYSAGHSFATLSNTSCTSVTHTSISPVSAVAETNPGLITLYAGAWLDHINSEPRGRCSLRNVNNPFRVENYDFIATICPNRHFIE